MSHVVCRANHKFCILLIIVLIRDWSRCIYEKKRNNIMSKEKELIYLGYFDGEHVTISMDEISSDGSASLARNNNNNDVKTDKTKIVEMKTIDHMFYSFLSTTFEIDDNDDNSASSASDNNNIITNGINNADDEESDEDEEESDNHIRLFHSPDSYLLGCEGVPTKFNQIYNYLKQKEVRSKVDATNDTSQQTNINTLDRIKSKIFGTFIHTMNQDEDNLVDFSFYQASQRSIENTWTGIQQDGDWSVDFTLDSKTKDCDEKKHSSFIKILDLTSIQKETRKMLSKTSHIYHLLRSTLSCDGGSSHFTSPYNEAYGDSIVNQSDFSIGILLRNDADSAIDQAILKNIIRFRVGDASPSFNLYSVTQLIFDGSDSIFNQLYSPPEQRRQHEQVVKGVTLLVYRNLPSRLQFTKQLPSPLPSFITNQEDYKSKIQYENSLWEVYCPNLNDSDKDDDDEPEDISTKILQYRQVSAPYQSIQRIYPNLHEKIQNVLLSPSNLSALIHEASSIPQWTAWPEDLYGTGDSSDSEEEENEQKPPSWSVFPLCHTFPAYELKKRKFIQMTCDYVPKTTHLLKEVFGPLLRTALFSRLKAKTALDAHTGWADLANHVLRLHIPLIVPVGSVCGTWVDGCVEEQRVGKVLCFDDSKVHRAFNYSDSEDRIVLIVDIYRNSSSGEEGEGGVSGDECYEGVPLPIGTSTGGHSDELDKFIQQFD